MRRVDNELYLGEELLARAVAEARCEKSRRLSVGVTLHAVHERAGVGGQKSCRLVLRSEFFYIIWKILRWLRLQKSCPSLSVM